MWSLYGERFSDSDFSGAPRVYQPFTLTKNLKLKALRTSFVFYGSPAYTSLGMRIYDDKGGVPTTLKATFDKIWAPAELLTLNYGVKEIWFDFDNALWLRKGTKYHLAPYIVGSSFSGASHVSWVHGFPDPNTETLATLSIANIMNVPYFMALIGAEY